MKKTFFLSLIFAISAPMVPAQSIGTFTSVNPGTQTQTQNFIYPASHEFHVILRHNDPLTMGGTAADNFDFTGYLPTGGSSEDGWLAINHELTTGGVTSCQIRFNPATGRWSVLNSGIVNFTPVAGTRRNCSGGISYRNSTFTAEETMDVLDANGDGYQDFGWIVELNPVTRTVVDQDGDGSPDKIWKMGRTAHENVASNANGSVLYTGGDNGSSSYLFKYVPAVAGNLSAGTLYALQVSGSTGTWLTIPNSTPAQCNNTTSAAGSAGATSLNGIEDVEIGPDGKIYFTSKGNAVIYRFNDLGTTISGFETYAGGSATNYTINYGSGTANIAWGTGNDNLAFDGDGNLWVLQDGGFNHIWMIRSGHTQASPRVELFGRTPSGAEPTGITFTPDYRFMFISFQHPSSGNATSQPDCDGNAVVMNRDMAIVVARAEHLGAGALPAPFASAALTQDDASLSIEWILHQNPGNGHFSVEIEAGGKTDNLDGPDCQPQQNSYSMPLPLPAHSPAWITLKHIDENGNVLAITPLRYTAETGNTHKLSVSPLPFVQVLNIRFDRTVDVPSRLELLDASGKLIDTHSLAPETMAASWDLGEVPAGVYILRWVSMYGDHSIKIWK